MSALPPITEVVRHIQLSIWLSVYEYTPWQRRLAPQQCMHNALIIVGEAAHPREINLISLLDAGLRRRGCCFYVIDQPVAVGVEAERPERPRYLQQIRYE